MCGFARTAASNASRVRDVPAVDGKSPQQTTVRPQGLQVVLVLDEQDTGFVVHTTFQQSG